MAFKFVFLVALCLAQGFAFQVRGNDVCTSGADAIPHEFEEVVHEMDEIRETVSMAALEAYSNGKDWKVALACFGAHGGKYVKFGFRMARMITAASLEMAGTVVEKVDQYERLIEPRIKNIVITMSTLPATVQKHIQDKEYFKAYLAVREARKVVVENSLAVAKHIKELAVEVPQIAKRAEELAKEIREEAKNTSTALREIFTKCIEEGGPKKPGHIAAEEEDEESAEE